MGKGILGTVKLGVIIGVILLAGIGVLYATNIFESADAKEMAVKAMWVVGIFTAASLIITLVAAAGKSSGPDG